MLTLLMFAQIAAAPLPPKPALTEERTVIERQLATPPRHGPAAGISAEEADAISAAYLESIGKKLTLPVSDAKSQ